MNSLLAPLCAFAFLVLFLIMSVKPPEVVGFSRVQFLLIAGVMALFLATTPIRAGVREVLPNRVTVCRRATWVTPKRLPLEQILLIGAGVAALASAALFIHEAGGVVAAVQTGAVGIALGPILGIGGAMMIISNLWQLLRGIKMTPESLTYWRGFGRITVSWDELGEEISTNDVRDHERRRKHVDAYLPGAKIVVPVERALGVKLPVHWEGADTPRLLLETDHFAVESSALLTAILELRDNRDLRALLGTHDSKVLFVGPQWKVRRRMRRGQQWWPPGALPAGLVVDNYGVVKGAW